MNKDETSIGGTRIDAKAGKNRNRKVFLLSENSRQLKLTTRGVEEGKKQLIIQEWAEATQKISRTKTVER
jgi:hypothetical protein